MGEHSKNNYKEVRMKLITIEERSDFYRFLKKISLFSLPFLFMLLLNYIIDPYNLNRKIPSFLEKKETACFFNERLWKLNNFLQNPQPYIILGDSRSARFNAEQITNIANKDFINLSFSGATLIEIIDTFWFITTQIKPKELYLCINFDRFNDWQKANAVHEAITTINNPFLHYLQPQTTKIVYSLIRNTLFKKKLSQAPPVDQAAFWDIQIAEADQGYKRFTFPFYATKQLRVIADYCKEHTIKLFFIIFPTHIDFQKRIAIAGLQDQEKEFKLFLQSLAPVYDFDNENSFTSDKNNFDDPKHLSYNATNYVTTQIWRSQTV